MPHSASPGQIWRDECYYLDSKTNSCMPKYVLVLAVDPNTGDAVTVVLTSVSNGLPEVPTCYIGFPRSGYYLGVPGSQLNKETWLDFSSIVYLDSFDLDEHIKKGQKSLLKQKIPVPSFCDALRCIVQIQEDIPKLLYKWLLDTIEELNCP